MARDFLVCIGATGLVIALTYFGAFQSLGAHPWWHTSVALIGAPAGAVLGFLLRRGRWAGPVQAVICLVLSLGALAVAHLGKTRFAASFAEDVAAGQMWYFGWITTAAFATLMLSLLPRPR